MSNDPAVFFTLTGQNIGPILIVLTLFTGAVAFLWKQQMAAKNATIETLTTQLRGGEESLKERLEEIENSNKTAHQAIEKIQVKLAANEPVPEAAVTEAATANTVTSTGIAQLLDERSPLLKVLIDREIREK